MHWQKPAEAGRVRQSSTTNDRIYFIYYNGPSLQVLLQGVDLFELLFTIAAFGFSKNILDVGLEIVLVVHQLLDQGSQIDQMKQAQLLSLQALQQPFVVFFQLGLQQALQLIVICLLHVVSAITHIGHQFEYILEFLHNVLRFWLLGQLLQGGHTLGELVTIEIVLIFKEVVVLVEQEVAVFTFLHQVLTVLTHRYPSVLQVAHQSLGLADIVSKGQKLNDALYFTADIERLLSYPFTDTGENTVFVCSEFKEKFETTHLGLLVGSMHLFAPDFLHHLVIDFLQLLQHIVECGSLLGIISEHVVGEKLPIRMEVRVILHSSLAVFVKMPLVLKFFKGLNDSSGTLTFLKRSLPVSISQRIMPAPQTSQHFEYVSSYLLRQTQGAAYSGVPICPVTKMPVVSRASPKSLILTSFSMPMRILSGLRSRCILSLAFMQHIPSNICLNSSRALSQEMPSLMRSVRVPLGQNSTKMQALSLMRSKPQQPMIEGWLSEARVIRVSTSRSHPSPYTVLMATCLSRFMEQPRKTSPQQPFPSRPSGSRQKSSVSLIHEESCDLSKAGILPKI